ncbi:hypothetical protein JRQ81_005970 [Phrynocephalus forsythii]|uniref:Uncharacterized protein n=1 Tax=Phrynocephalus forsythii TaxID=171643 RepID=A0A9Q1AVQ0_9SAUR|nr:hypothetical protein JRQ81_005970 [Phrynocephalus forsythii]
MWSPEASLLLQLLGASAVPTKVILTTPQLGTVASEPLGDTNGTTDSLPRQPLWFDYPDSDEKKIHAIYKWIGEDHEFVGPSLFPNFLRYILIGSIVLILLYFLFQIISKLMQKRSSM